MKAKQLILGEKSEIVLQNGTVYSPREKESIADFKTRVEKEAEEEFLESIDVKEFGIKKVKAYSSKQMLNTLPNAKGLLKEMVEQVLTKRGIEFTPVEEIEVEAEKVPVIPVKAPTKKESRAKNPERKKLLEEFKTTSTYLNAKKLIGKSITYKNRGNEKPSSGVIRGLMIDRTITKAHYVVVDPKTKKRNLCILENITFE